MGIPIYSLKHIHGLFLCSRHSFRSWGDGQALPVGFTFWWGRDRSEGVTQDGIRKRLNWSRAGKMSVHREGREEHSRVRKHMSKDGEGGW